MPIKPLVKALSGGHTCTPDIPGRLEALDGCSLLDAIRMLLARSWSVSIYHISRMHNLVVDRVVALCRDSLTDSMPFDYVLAVLVELVRKETVDT
ncbi:hypothetical protein V6N11_084078 [Hibiscus sabdariffa]|uniref:Uncharacterized protein n=1 Tax=Hibiscus sabdariffa TaxID=183260 RepID=A0ABR2QDL5_9ROSI